MKHQAVEAQGFAKFEDPQITAKGERRASVSLSNPQTLWFNTGTVCNITCQRCYIESSPTNDRLIYFTEADLRDYLNQIVDRKWPVKEIAFTGGEPFMNPEMIGMARASLEAGYEVLILTNAMRPMMRPHVQGGLLGLRRDFGSRLTLRVSVDHHTAGNHDSERGAGTFEQTLKGMCWLRDNDIHMTIAGRTVWGESDARSRLGYAGLFAEHGFAIDADDPGQTVLFPEMDLNVDVPEITTDCWQILDKSPNDVMCSSSRMVVRRKGSDQPVVLACTLLAYSEEFEMGHTLQEAEKDVLLNHPHCSKFCVLGGASCSA